MVKELKEISFHSHTITSKGIKADPKKITALLEMTSPTDEAGVRRFCGISTVYGTIFARIINYS